jgi:hypothetical protein
MGRVSLMYQIMFQDHYSSIIIMLSYLARISKDFPLTLWKNIFDDPERHISIKN